LGGMFGRSGIIGIASRMCSYSQFSPKRQGRTASPRGHADSRGEQRARRDPAATSSRCGSLTAPRKAACRTGLLEGQ
ncbi:hypothetical protein, partial [Exiguobacterium sp. SH3S3]|uniref:hypothetical protein n=1 Tax=Exiguobacterium sp. SH3S3 TaxID=2510957 RepID=UPI001375E368